MKHALQLALTLALAAPLARALPPESTDGGPAPNVVLVSRGDLTTGLERDGKLEAKESRRVLLDLEEFSGRLRVIEVHPSLRQGGAVEQGAVLLRIDPAPLERVARAAREGLDAARVALALAQQDDALAQAATRDALEQADVASRDAARALERFQTLDGPNLLDSAALGLASAQHSLDDQKEELSQLEQIYRGTELAPETKEIVLERARRNVRQLEGGLEVEKRSATVQREWEHPDHLKHLQDGARWASEALAQARDRARLDDERRKESLAAAARAVRDGEEQLARLEADRARLTVTAPINGAVEAVDLRVGDLVGAGQAITTVHDVSALVVRFPASEEDLRLLATGQKVVVRLPAFAEVELAGHVASIDEVAQQQGDAPTFTTRVELEETAPLLRVGLRARVAAEGEIVRKALTVPRKAVVAQDGRTFCKVWANGRETPVEVVLGPGNKDSVQVLHGLVSGDAVVCPEQ